MPRKPPTRLKTKATTHQSTIVSHRGEIVRSEQKSDVVDITTKPGSAQIGVTHGVKFWASDSSAGMTVESTCHITLSCEQRMEEIQAANEEASNLAFQLMHKNGDKMRKYIEDHFK